MGGGLCGGDGRAAQGREPLGRGYQLQARSAVLIRFFFSSRRRHTRFDCDWSSDVCSSDLGSPVRSATVTCEILFLITSAACNCSGGNVCATVTQRMPTAFAARTPFTASRSEERRVGEEGRSRWSPYH